MTTPFKSLGSTTGVFVVICRNPFSFIPTIFIFRLSASVRMTSMIPASSSNASWSRSVTRYGKSKIPALFTRFVNVDEKFAISKAPVWMFVMSASSVPSRPSEKISTFILPSESSLTFCEKNCAFCSRNVPVPETSPREKVISSISLVEFPGETGVCEA